MTCVFVSDFLPTRALLCPGLNHTEVPWKLVVSLTPSLIDVSPGFHGSTAAPSVLDPQSSGVIIGWESKFPSDFFSRGD